MVTAYVPGSKIVPSAGSATGLGVGGWDAVGGCGRAESEIQIAGLPSYVPPTTKRDPHPTTALAHVPTGLRDSGSVKTSSSGRRDHTRPSADVQIAASSGRHHWLGARKR